MFKFYVDCEIIFSHEEKDLIEIANFDSKNYQENSVH